MYPYRLSPSAIWRLCVFVVVAAAAACVASTVDDDAVVTFRLVELIDMMSLLLLLLSTVNCWCCWSWVCDGATACCLVLLARMSTNGMRMETKKLTMDQQMSSMYMSCMDLMLTSAAGVFESVNQTWYKRKMKSKSKVENVKIEYEKMDRTIGGLPGSPVLDIQKNSLKPYQTFNTVVFWWSFKLQEVAFLY